MEEENINNLLLNAKKLNKTMQEIKSKIVPKIEKINKLIAEVDKRTCLVPRIRRLENDVKTAINDAIAKKHAPKEIAESVTRQMRAEFPAPNNQIKVNYQREQNKFTIDIENVGGITLSDTITSSSQKTIEESMYWFKRTRDVKGVEAHINKQCSTKHHKAPFGGSFEAFQKARGAA